ncbi:molybdopterin-dependent oxidoreductase [Allopontixanthobacter sp.]|uniref:molybdopterin-dependent oxidoreductase n=1 Tax=Allopontixanthobacter sp. TaxID=2906452 RepID=UPI002AB8FC88|nr:molybdopterin-dependent oxidoreductase [Allopontixanthobacter sp.]MDZ4307164.1 molybdopterin-dependent oxidoreductase [Allopontixanthobacter sp.]
MTETCTTCPYCGVGCGIHVDVNAEREITVTGDPAHPANSGRLCSKGTHLAETVSLEGRLLDPEIGGEKVEWDEALALVAARFADTITKYGPDSVAFYVSGQLLTEDYYVANKLMKGFIGSSNIDTNSRLCMASAVAAHTRAFGEDVVPCNYDDLEAADLILLVGSNTAWCHPVIWQRIEQARATRGTKLVVIDPRRTETAECADLHLPICPDGDVALFNALLANMAARDLIDRDYLAAHTNVPERFWDGLAGSPEEAGINTELFAQFADLVAAHPKMITLFSQGANQSRSGTDKGNAITNLHLAMGRIGLSGMGPFSITGQPNAMGGREVGGLASMLAVHMGFSDAECEAAKTFWNSPTIARKPGLKAVDMFRAVHDGKIKAIWIMATNPAVSMPDAGYVREALAACEFVVVSDVIAQTDTTALADVKLPALAWGEKDGTVTNSERVISRQRAFFAAPGETRADWWAICEVAKRMGFSEFFDFSTPAAIFREYAAQTGFRNCGRRKLDLSEWAGTSDDDYKDWTPKAWGGATPFADGRFSTPDGKARLVAVISPSPPIANPAFPLRLNTGRYRDQWHTMTRTGLSPRLSGHRREALVEIHPADAASRHVLDGSIARISTPQGDTIFRVLLTDNQRPGEVFAPMHWTDQMSSGGRANRLPNQTVDPVSGQPAFKNSACDVTVVTPEWRAFLVSRSRPVLPALLYWSSARIAGGWLTELAGEGNIDVEFLLPEGERMEAVDLKRGMRRIAVRSADGMLAAALFLTRNGELPLREWIATQLACEGESDTPSLLAGRPREAQPDRGAIVCVCFDVGTKQIIKAVSDQSLTSVEGVGASLNAGTNCGSCRPALAKLLAEARAHELEAAK